MVMVRLLTLFGSVILIMKTSVAQLEVRPRHVLLLDAGEGQGSLVAQAAAVSTAGPCSFEP